MVGHFLGPGHRKVMGLVVRPLRQQADEAEAADRLHGAARATVTPSCDIVGSVYRVALGAPEISVKLAMSEGFTEDFFSVSRPTR